MSVSAPIGRTIINPFKMLSNFVLLLIVLSPIVASQSIVESFPGFNGDLPFKLETGYVGVGKMDEIQLFYYFVESERSPQDDPLVLWLTGGPGCSGFSCFAYQHGPLYFDFVKSKGKNPSFVVNKHSWTKVANIIFVDAPVGTGFSYATNSKAYQTSDLLSAAQSYEFLKKWLISHPGFQSNPVYVGGDSYSGKIVPVVVEELTNDIERGLVKPPMNFKGYILGNPFTDWKYDFGSRVPNAHKMSIISDELYESTKKHCNGEYMNPDAGNLQCIENLRLVNETLNRVFWLNMVEPRCETLDLNIFRPKDAVKVESISTKLDVISPTQRFGEWCRDYVLVPSYFWANDRNVQKALHIREGTVKEWARCNGSLDYTRDVFSAIEYHKKFTTKGYRALIFSGDQDLAISYYGTHAWIETLNLTTARDWQPWFVNGRLAGDVITYSKNDYNLTFVTVKGAGHTATEYKPKECFAMIDRWFSYNPL